MATVIDFVQDGNGYHNNNNRKKHSVRKRAIGIAEQSVNVAIQGDYYSLFVPYKHVNWKQI